MRKKQDTEETLKYHFKDKHHLELALIHKSYGNENSSHLPIHARDNEQLEFLGDAVLDLVISQLLLELYPDQSEGNLSKLRAGLVNEKTLAETARSLDLGKMIFLGKGEEQTGGRDKESILASTFEALIAAVYEDGGFKKVEKWLKDLFLEKAKSSFIQDLLCDNKTKLQEVVQSLYKSTPRYELIQSTGPDHDKTFLIKVIINEKIEAKASGKSKKEAEQNAAEIALKQLEK